MSVKLPDRLDPVQFAERRRELQGEVSIARMARLASLVQGCDGMAGVELSFGYDMEGTAVILGRVFAHLVLRCERCLGEMEWPVDRAVSLALVMSEDEARRLPGDYDPLLVGEGSISLLELIEDELLLALPQVARHELEVCPGPPSTPEEAEDPSGRANTSPFEVLAQLKGKLDH